MMLSDEQAATLRAIVIAISTGNNRALKSLKNISLYNDEFEWDTLRSYGIEFGLPKCNFERHVELIAFKNRPGFAFEVRMRDSVGKLTNVVVNFEFHNEFDPPKIYVGWPSLI